MKSALIVVDAQQSFLKRPYWSETDAPRFIERLQMLIDRCVAQGVPVLSNGNGSSRHPSGSANTT